ncbi:IspD/TarI family cytidylyltransferase [Ornithinimicrobium sp. W1665]|uniref:IspD/TarI family cytidylyltransferase n=1 Tax=Ornithinimicrobium sp. W1665 TaxID=3416666 RepID=UPI003D6B49CE
MADTIKQVRTGPTGVETVVATLDRSTLRSVQTPQGFLRETLERAHAAPPPAPATDDCGMVEAHGGRVTVVEGSPRALKITTPHDLEVAAGWLRPAGGAHD